MDLFRMENKKRAREKLICKEYYGH
jgi:hypothetical protein